MVTIGGWGMKEKVLTLAATRSQAALPVRGRR